MRVIGTGGFASVWMAKQRTTGTGGGTATMEGHLRNEGAEAEETMEDDENDRRRKQQRKGQQRSEYVAIKIMKNDVHAEREISILSELSDMSHPHPNIVRLLRSSFDEKDEFMNAKDSEKASSRAMVLSLAYGPTLHHVLNECGHLGLVISNVISGQLIRAIAFLHGHAGEFGFVRRGIVSRGGGAGCHA
jgi:serine/threonine protein kinase